MRIRGSLLAVVALMGLAATACGGGGAAGSPPSAAGVTPRVGGHAPGFSLPSAQGGNVSLAKALGAFSGTT